MRYEGESLALVLFNIGAFREADLSESALSRMDLQLQCIERLGFDLILRICYDTEGKGMVREPSLFSQVKKHVLQLSPLLLSHAEHIFVFQGLLVGNWGEMHGSKFLFPDKVRELAKTFLEATGAQIPLAVRKPSQYRMAFAKGEERPRIGFFNDGMLGSQTHLGTFAAMPQENAPWQEPWSMEEECKFMEPHLLEVPYGGEVVSGPEKLSPEQTIEELRMLHVSYLNSMHDRQLLDLWKETPYQDGSLYEYISERLGYRFLVREVKVTCKKELRISVKIENDGFGMLYDEAFVEISAKREGAEKTTLGALEGSLKGLRGGESRILTGSFELSGNELSGSGLSGSELSALEAGRPEKEASPKGLQLFARIIRKRDHKTLYFSQASEDGALLLGSLR